MNKNLTIASAITPQLVVIDLRSTVNTNSNYFAATAKGNVRNTIVLASIDCRHPQLSRYVWNLMNRGVEGVALSCDDLQQQGIGLTSKPMMQMFRMLEDRGGYLLVDFGSDQEHLQQMGQVVGECTGLQVMMNVQH
ncbi:MAG: hypothetical protein J5552_04560 [Prevotella sp.]|nr:hypothetical protein [Prevotella sp.]